MRKRENEEKEKEGKGGHRKKRDQVRKEVKGKK
jgi:hypothetical protein